MTCSVLLLIFHTDSLVQVGMKEGKYCAAHALVSYGISELLDQNAILPMQRPAKGAQFFRNLYVKNTARAHTLYQHYIGRGVPHQGRVLGANISNLDVENPEQGCPNRSVLFVFHRVLGFKVP